MADGEDTDHESPLNLGSSFKKVVAVASHGTAKRDKEKRINGDQDGE